MNKINRVARVMFILYVAGGTIVSASAGFASDVERVDVIENLRGKMTQPDSIKTHKRNMRVDVIESIGSGGARYPYTGARRVDVIEGLEGAVTHSDNMNVTDRNGTERMETRPH